MPYFYFDPYYIILILPAILLAGLAQAKVKSAYRKYKKISTERGFTGEQAAREILDANGLHNVAIMQVQGELTDHFDPRDNVLRLSRDVYTQKSISAIGIAAHEAGHAIQCSKGYVPFKVRSAIVPLTQIGSKLSFPLIIAGVIFSFQPLITIGILLFSLVFIFQLVTLPVEFNASSRARKTLVEQGIIVSYIEENGVKSVLNAAALTYVAALIVTLAHLLRYVLLFTRRND